MHALKYHPVLFEYFGQPICSDLSHFRWLEKTATSSADRSLSPEIPGLSIIDNYEELIRSLSRSHTHSRPIPNPFQIRYRDPGRPSVVGEDDTYLVQPAASPLTRREPTIQGVLEGGRCEAATKDLYFFIEENSGNFALAHRAAPPDLDYNIDPAHRTFPTNFEYKLRPATPQSQAMTRFLNLRKAGPKTEKPRLYLVNEPEDSPLFVIRDIAECLSKSSSNWLRATSFTERDLVGLIVPDAETLTLPINRETGSGQEKAKNEEEMAIDDWVTVKSPNGRI